MRNYNVGLMHILCQVVYNGEQIVWLRRKFKNCDGQVIL